jgi:Fe-S oxidoreductase
LISDHPDAEVLFWVGCAGAFDARAQKVTIATAKLLKHAGVNFAILGLEETCTGDPARRAGNEFLFQMMAEQNCETFKGHNIERIITACPHCFNTLKNEYPDFGGKFEVVHHTDFLLDLVRRGKLEPQKEVSATVAYHDSCYLGRYNDIYDSPREILRSIPGVTVVEPEDTRDRGMCCGAGGAQMFKEEEEGDERVNAVRTGQLLSALDSQRAASFSSRGPTTGVDDSSLGASAQAEACGSLNAVASACPFCMRMLSDGIADKQREDVRQLDVAEVLCESVLEKELTAEH